MPSYFGPISSLDFGEVGLKMTTIIDWRSVAMPKIHNFYFPTHTILQFDFINGPGYIFDRSQSDYMNWVPVNFQLILPSEQLTFLRPPTLSIESIRLLIAYMNSLFQERESVGSHQGFNYPFKRFDFTATEGEFSISLQNIFDYYESDLVSLTVWMNMACCIPCGEGLEKGARFCVLLDELKQFYTELLVQLNKLTA